MRHAFNEIVDVGLKGHPPLLYAAVVVIMRDPNRELLQYGNLPSDPASQSATGITKAIQQIAERDPGDSLAAHFNVFSDEFEDDGISRSGHITVIAEGAAENRVNVYCIIFTNDGFSSAIMASINPNGFANVDFTCDFLNIQVQDISDGTNAGPVDLTYAALFVETDDVTER